MRPALIACEPVRAANGSCSASRMPFKVRRGIPGPANGLSPETERLRNLMHGLPGGAVGVAFQVPLRFGLGP
jgi:hypothetical protein